MSFTIEKPAEIEAHLNNNPYLTEGGLPGAADAEIYFALNGQVPDVTATPNYHHWFYFINSFSNDLMKTWVEKASKGANKTEAKKDDDDDLFGDDDTPAPVVAKPKVEIKKKKPKAAAKSIIVFDVKVYDTETDLDALAKRCSDTIHLDGLVWSTDIKKIEVAFGIFKLQMGCVIEDEKVMTDDIF